MSMSHLIWINKKYDEHEKTHVNLFFFIYVNWVRKKSEIVRLENEVIIFGIVLKNVQGQLYNIKCL